jgi:ATP-dependent Clp protease protease subunit
MNKTGPINSSPFILETSGKREYLMDVTTRLYKERIIYITGEIETNMAMNIVQQIKCLELDNSKQPIVIFINSPGGSVIAGIAILNEMMTVACEIITVCTGICASMGAVLLAAGSKGNRWAYQHSRIMIHQISGGFRGNLDDILIQCKETMILEKYLYDILSRSTGLDYVTVENLCQRDCFLSAFEAQRINIVDKIVQSRKDLNAPLYEYDINKYSDFDITLSKNDERLPAFLNKITTKTN